MKMLDQGHGEVALSPADRERLHPGLDANALFYGTFDVHEQRKQTGRPGDPGLVSEVCRVGAAPPRTRTFRTLGSDLWILE